MDGWMDGWMRDDGWMDGWGLSEGSYRTLIECSALLRYVIRDFLHFKYTNEARK